MSGIFTAKAGNAYQERWKAWTVCLSLLLFFSDFTTGKHWIMKQNPRNTHVSYDFCFQLVLIFWYDQFYYSYNGSILTHTITCKPNSDSAMWGEKLFVCGWRELGTKHIHRFSAFILYPTIFPQGRSFIPPFCLYLPFHTKEFAREQRIRLCWHELPH